MIFYPNEKPSPSASFSLLDSEKNPEPVPFKLVMSMTLSRRILRGIITFFFNKDNG